MTGIKMLSKKIAKEQLVKLKELLRKAEKADKALIDLIEFMTGSCEVKKLSAMIKSFHYQNSTFTKRAQDEAFKYYWLDTGLANEFKTKLPESLRQAIKTKLVFWSRYYDLRDSTRPWILHKHDNGLSI